MKPRIYTPGAGHQPPVLAGRDDQLRDWSLMLNDAAARGRVAARDTILVGPRGVGKTALLTAYARIAQAQGTVVVDLQAVRGEAGLIESLMQHARRLTAEEAGPWRRARASFERLAGFNIGLAGIGAGVSLRDTSTAPARPDAGSLAGALARLAAEVAKDHSSGGLLITVDELQVAAHPDLALLAATLHRLNVDHSGANVTFAASGLPFTTSVLNAAGVTHPDRLFEVVDVPLTLPPNDARYALVEPARAEHVAWEVAALDRVLTVTNGYPAHLQLVADAVWRAAKGPDAITLADVEATLPGLVDQLDRRTFGPRWERLTDRQAEFLAALALHGGRAGMADLARTLNRTSTDLSWLRDQLIKEGDIYPPRYGHVAMAVPLFTEFVLARYPQDRLGPSSELLTLEQMSNYAQNTSLAPSPPRPGGNPLPRTSPRHSLTPGPASPEGPQR